MKGESKKGIKFFAPDGAFISKSTSFAHIMHIPYFVMKIDGEMVKNTIGSILVRFFLYKIIEEIKVETQ